MPRPSGQNAYERADNPTRRRRHYPAYIVDGDDAAAYVWNTFKRSCSASTIRHWVRTDGLREAGRDGKRILYDLNQVHEIAARKRRYLRP